MKAFFAIPGDLNTPTGGYAYARRVLAEIGVAEVDLTPLPLPPGFPQVGEAEVSAALDALAGADAPVLLDALAGGALPGDALARLPVPVVMLCHHPLALETGMTPDDAARLRDSETAALAACRHVITASDTTAQILEADYAVPGDKLTVARPGTDPAPLAAGSGGPGLRIVSVGSLSRRKGHDLLISALAGVEQAWTLRIIGPALDPAYADQLRTQIEAQGLTDRVTLVGALATEALEREYHQADLFVLASHYEGFGMAFVEAVARGLPVLGLSCDAVAEATLGAALLVPPQRFAETLTHLISDPAFRAEMAETSRETAEDLQRWPETARIIADVLREVAT